VAQANPDPATLEVFFDRVAPLIQSSPELSQVLHQHLKAAVNPSVRVAALRSLHRICPAERLDWIREVLSLKISEVERRTAWIELGFITTEEAKKLLQSMISALPEKSAEHAFLNSTLHRMTASGRADPCARKP
jgi:vesicle coat complex subunit